MKFDIDQFKVILRMALPSGALAPQELLDDAFASIIDQFRNASDYGDIDMLDALSQATSWAGGTSKLTGIVACVLAVRSIDAAERDNPNLAQQIDALYKEQRALRKIVPKPRMAKGCYR